MSSDLFRRRQRDGTWARIAVRYEATVLFAVLKKWL